MFPANQIDERERARPGCRRERVSASMEGIFTGVAMDCDSPVGMKTPLSCRPGPLTRRYERFGASMECISTVGARFGEPSTRALVEVSS